MNNDLLAILLLGYVSDISTLAAYLFITIKCKITKAWGWTDSVKCQRSRNLINHFSRFLTLHPKYIWILWLKIQKCSVNPALNAGGTLGTTHNTNTTASSNAALTMNVHWCPCTTHQSTGPRLRIPFKLLTFCFHLGGGGGGQDSEEHNKRWEHNNVAL